MSQLPRRAHRILCTSLPPASSRPAALALPRLASSLRYPTRHISQHPTALFSWNARQRHFSTQPAVEAPTGEEEAPAKAEGGEKTLLVGDNAARKIKSINAADKTDLLLRVAVDSGGCHGYQYIMEMTGEINEDDVVFEKDGARVVVDTVSLDFIGGSKLDFVEELIGSSFQILDNPKAESSLAWPDLELEA
ncbi:hypothetical protein HK104_001050 [Borealophlyctis nickersoniae]|nr:hypothetical protein HK104_001050 [Borealophlyctis nickersoniae]